MNRTIRIVAASLVGISLLASAIAPIVAKASEEEELSRHQETLQELRKKSIPWIFPHLAKPVTETVAIDTDVETRGIANRRVIDRLGYPANKVALADRVHSEFSAGSAVLSEHDREIFRRLAVASDGSDHLVVTGYAGHDEEGGSELARQRAEKIVAVIRDANPDLKVRIDSSKFWSGTSDNARRAEVYRFRGLATQ